MGYGVVSFGKSCLDHRRHTMSAQAQAYFDRLAPPRPIRHSRHGRKPSIIYVNVLGLGTQTSASRS